MIAPAISVVLSVYNGERHLERAIDSVLTQTCGDFELILIDDGSTDGTAEIIAAAAARDARVVCVRHPNAGLAVSLNRGIALAKGRFIARHDADDISMANRFEQQLRWLEEHEGTAAVGTAADVIDDNGRVVVRLRIPSAPDAVRRELLAIRDTPVHGSMMMRKSVIQRAGGYREAFQATQDYDLWLRLTETHAIENLPDALYQWRVGSTSVYGARRERQLRYAGIARAFTEERRLEGADSYDLLAKYGDDLDRFADVYRHSALMHALWGELLFRGIGNSDVVRRCLRVAFARGHRTPRVFAELVWAHLGLPWPGGRPLAAGGEAA